MNNEHHNADEATLNEGEEVKLGIRPQHFASSNNHQHQQGLHEKPASSELEHYTHHHANSHTSTTHNAPKIDLHPRPGARVSPQKPLKKRRRFKESVAAVRSHRHWHNAKLVVGTVLVFLLIFNSQWFISQLMYLFPSRSDNKPAQQQTTQQQPATQQPQIQPNQPEVVGPENEIIIPKIGVKAPLVFINTNSEKDVLAALRNGVVHYYGTALPGEVGNSVFFGHSSNDWWESGNYKFVFILLEKLTAGDIYEIHYNSKKYVYKVSSTKVVEPNDLSVLNQTATPTSTLITCTPPGTSWRRFVVFADQVAPAPTQQVSTAPTAQKVVSADTKLPSAPKNLLSQITDWFKGLLGGNQEKPTSEPVVQQAPQHLPEVN